MQATVVRCMTTALCGSMRGVTNVRIASGKVSGEKLLERKLSVMQGLYG